MGSDKKGITYLSYFGILALVPFLTEKNDEFVQFHAKQGLNLFIIEFAAAMIFNVIRVILAFASDNLFLIMLSIGIGFISMIIYIIFFVVSIIGIVNVSKGERTPLPVVGSIQIIK